MTEQNDANMLRWSQLFQAMILGFAVMWLVRVLLPVAGEWAFPEWYRQFAFEHPRLALYLFDSLVYLVTVAGPCIAAGVLVGKLWTRHALTLAFIVTLPLFLSEAVLPFMADRYHKAWFSAYPFLAVTRMIIALTLIPLCAWIMAHRRARRS